PEGSERHDPLTGLETRDAFRLRMDGGLQSAARRACPVALLLVDVDTLRSINDRLGRSAGDDVLRRLAGILRATVGEEDYVARIADDDFAILLSGAGRGEARQTAARLRSTVERFRFFGVQGGGTAIKVTLSVGAASFPADAESVSDLIQRSQEALDEARALGRNRVWCYTRRPRVPLRAPVYLDGSEPLLVGYMRDLSPSGIFVQTSDPIEIGMRCAMVFPVPTSDAKVHIIGRIVRTVPLQDATADARIPGMGIEFEKIGSRDRRSIDTFLYEQESAGMRPGCGLLNL
ncbi:MAG: diguanylate cyclase domain-containing protein, partial [Vicinamibacteria bacterium]